MELSGQILKLFKNVYENSIVNSVLPTYFELLQNKNSSESEILNALCIFDDLIEHCSD